jgi:hypothetical protein
VVRRRPGFDLQAAQQVYEGAQQQAYEEIQRKFREEVRHEPCEKASAETRDGGGSADAE